MKIILASDSHGNKDAVKYLFENKQFDLFIFCGDGLSDFGPYKNDKRLLTVCGNCDWFCDSDNDIVKSICGKNFFICHGDESHVKSTMVLLKQLANQNQADVVCFGHTHKMLNQIIDGRMYLNPGALLDNKYMEIFFDEKNEMFVTPCEIK